MRPMHHPPLRVLVLVAVAIAAAPSVVHAQVRPDTSAIDSLRAEIDRLRGDLRELRQQISPPGADPAVAPADTADPLAALRAAAAAAAGTDTTSSDTVPARETPAAASAGGRAAGGLNVFNPEISVSGDVIAAFDADHPAEESFLPREFEISFVSNLDPYSRAKVFVGHHVPGLEFAPFEGDGHAPPQPGPEQEEAEETGAETEIEEGYVEWLGLPGGIGFTLGKFRQRFGTLNRWHAHSLPSAALPLPYLAFFGEEGLAQTGASVHWLPPSGGPITWEAWGELTRSSDEALFGESSGLSALGHINAFVPISDAQYFELGLSAITGPAEDEVVDERFGSRVWGMDFAYNWRPPRRALYRELTLRGGAVRGTRPVLDETHSAWGAFAIGEYRFSERWIGGARYEWTQNPVQPDEEVWLFAPALTWWQSEFVRLRAEFDVLGRLDDTIRRLVIQATFAMGPHKHETY